MATYGKAGAAALIGIILFSARAQAVSPADKCEAAKNKIAGKYAFCREKADAKAAATGAPADYSKCDQTFAQKWGLAEMKGGGNCPTNGDQAAMQSCIGARTTEWAMALGGGPSACGTCGDDVINVAGEQCDGTDLGGETCLTLGFTGGTLACNGCQFDTSGCTFGGSSGRLDTGQFVCDQGAGTLGPCPGSPPGQDGAVLSGVARSYTDNGDGTITDNVTGLMWEKLSADGSIHDWNTTYTWYTAFTTKIATLNSGGGFAGHTDWRLPNLFELETLTYLNNPLGGLIHQVFTTTIISGCTVLQCSLTGINSPYWSSTSWPISPPGRAFFVSFGGGGINADLKSAAKFVRAVRGGS